MGRNPKELWEPADPQAVIRLYRAQRQTIREQVRALGICANTLYLFLRRHQEPLRSGTSAGCIRSAPTTRYRGLHPCPRGCRHDDGRPVLMAQGQRQCIACALRGMSERDRDRG